MAVCACEPRVFTRKYSPYFRYFYAWCYEEFVLQQRLGWRYAHAVAQAVFPGEGGIPPEEDLIRGAWYKKWYKENPDPEKLGFLSPPEYFRQWCDSHPGEATELKERMTFGMIDPTRRPSGVRTQEYLGEQHRVPAPAYFAQTQPYAPSVDLGAMCQVLAMGMVVWFAGQCLKAAKP